MTVTSGLWWSVWWPWMTVWTIGLAAIVVAVVVWVRHDIENRRQRALGDPPSYPYYLRHEIMNLYRQHDVNPDSAENEDTTRSSRTFGAQAGGSVVSGSGSRNTDREHKAKWTYKAEPITVLSRVLDNLARKNAIVYVDFSQQAHIKPNKAVANVLRGRAQRGGGRAARLSEFRGGYVSLTATFHRANATRYRTVLISPYEKGDNLERLPRVRITCDSAALDQLPEHQFDGRCLGVYERWDPVAQELVLRPIAIFA